MKVGLYVIDMEASAGGGYVLRNEVALAALEYRGRHQFEIVGAANVPSIPGGLRAAPRRIIRRIRSRITKPESKAKLLLAEVKRKKIDILWFNHAGPIDVGLPYILNIFDLQHRLQPWFPEVSANGQWKHREEYWADAIRRASVVTVGSPEAKEQLSHFYGVPLDNIRPVPFFTPQGALDAPMDETVARESLPDVGGKYGIKGKFLFYPAQFWPHKNHVNLLHALKLLNENQDTQFSLALTGSDQGNKSFVEKVASDLGLADKVHFLDFVLHEDVLALYRQAFALTYVSFFGPENLPPLEALAFGCPVVLANIDGVKTLYGDTPILVDPKSPEAIASGIKWLLENPDTDRKRARAGRLVAERYSRMKYIKDIVAILDDFEPMRRCWP